MHFSVSAYILNTSISFLGVTHAHFDIGTRCRWRYGLLYHWEFTNSICYLDRRKSLAEQTIRGTLIVIKKQHRDHQADARCCEDVVGVGNIAQGCQRIECEGAQARGEGQAGKIALHTPLRSMA